MNQERFKRGNYRVICDYDNNDMLISGELYHDGHLVDTSTDAEQVEQWLRMPVT
jgi:hypothetical protein